MFQVQNQNHQLTYQEVSLRSKSLTEMHTCSYSKNKSGDTDRNTFLGPFIKDGDKRIQRST